MTHDGILKREDILAYPDGTWIITDRAVSKIIGTAPMTASKPMHAEGWTWRRKQLMDYLGMLTEVDR